MKKTLFILIAIFGICACENDTRPEVIFDTDANNELDDQHAIAYLLMNDDIFNIAAITTNVTAKDGGIQAQVDEAERVAKLVDKKVDILPGATEKFEEILPNIGRERFDGCESVNRIIEVADRHTPDNPLILIAVGKMTNVALALAKKPEIIPNIRLVFLGTNFPSYENEWNVVNDIPALNYVLSTDIRFEIVTVRYSEPTGTDAVRISIDQVRSDFAGIGPKVDPTPGRHSGEFTNFGDYSVSLFENIQLHENGTRALYDLVTVAIVKNPSWGTPTEIPAPYLEGNEWIIQNDNPRKITLWTDFNRDAIIGDFILTIDK